MNIKLGAFALIAAMSCAGAWAQNPFAGQTPIKVELKKSFSSRDAKVGAEITAQTDQDLMLGTTKVPKGSMLLGHIVDVTKHSKTTPNGSVTIVFDQVKPKKGDPMPIAASVYKLLPADDSGQRADVAGMRGNGSGVTTANGAPTGATGLDTATVAASSVRPGTDSNYVNGSVSASSAPVQVVSYIPGIGLSAVAGGAESGVFTARNDEVSIFSGMYMVVGIAPK